MTFFNNKIFFIFIFIFFICVQKTHSEDKNIVFPFTLNHQFKTFYGNGNQNIFNLESYRIIKDSVRVYINGFRIKPEKRFRIDYDTNNLTFFDPPPKGSIIKVYYRVIPINLKSSYYNREGFGVSKEKNYSVNNPIKNSPIEREVDKTSFEKSGNLIRGFSIHTDRGLTMNSGFRMDFRGDIGKNLEVIASLTDQNSPLQPEGNTQTLSEIDRIFFKVRGKGYETTLGDLSIDYNGTEFSNYHRKLQGISGGGKIGSKEFIFSAAVSKGKFNTNRFMGREGNQGPYQLTGKSGEKYIVVIGGTEKVWIDGELMKRGEDNDYIIEYANGQITFTRHRLITDESRIEVDFQYTDGNSRENIYSIKSEGDLYVKGLKYNMTLIKENDVQDENSTFSLSDIDFNPNSLQKLQKDGNNYYQSGVSYVGQGNGNYQKVDSLGTIYYSYVGENLGEYKVTFSRVGDEAGEYDFLGGEIYRWVGRSKGDYLPIIIIGSGESRSVGDIQLDFKPNDYISFNSEFALSQNSSGLTNKKNNGSAVNLGLSVSPKALSVKGLNLGKVNFSAKLKKRDENFYSIDRTREVEYHRKWDLKGDEIKGENELEVNAIISPRPYILFNAVLGKFGIGEYVKSGRNSMEIKISHKSLPYIFFKRESIKSSHLNNNYSGDWIREMGNIFYKFGSLKPSFEFEREIKKEATDFITDNGFNFSNIGGKIEYKKGNIFSGYSSFRLRKDKVFDEFCFSPSSKAFTRNIGLNFRKGSNFSASAEFINRSKKFADNREDIITNLGDIRIRFSTKNRGIVLQNNYQLSSERAPKKRRVYFQVEEGKGDYSINDDTGEYYPDINGNFITRTFATDEFHSVEGIKFGSTIDINFSKFLEKDNHNLIFKTLKGLKTKSIFRFEEKSKNKNQTPFFNIPSFNVQNNGNVFFGNVSILQDITFFENVKNFYMRMRLNYSSLINNQFVERSENRSFFEKSVEIKSNFVRNMGLLLNLKNKSLMRIFSNNPSWGRDIISNSANIEFFYKPDIKIEYKARFKLGKEKNNSIYNELSLYYISFMPSFRYSLTNKGRINGEFEWFKVQTSPKIDILAYEMAEGKRPGDNFRLKLNFQYRIANHITADFEYSGYKEKRGIFHIGRVEMRAFF